ncbi:DUF3810 domain-containing protein [Aestuariibaculum sediminum]|uniref:DUF3810 domain-containing protein n=1 Tax=Aestuariibaculum sediminum TaxID=2770637 RepID=A0A8J6U9G8_9FLAO|nr:DUF3810 domain-containing protein [Aestuariibaculum sediminum]MBD0833177.1 DUF3810 domain-containing protein [Aestuariibaculum sediminum]
MPKKNKTIIALLLVPQYLLVKLLSKHPEFIETYYSNGVYPLISKIFRFFLGWFPFSFGDVIYALALIYIVRWLFLNRKRVYRDTIQWLIDIFAAVSIVYGLFHLCWGLNYHRLPLHKNLNLNADYTTEQLVDVTNKLINTSNKIHLKITQNDTVKVVIPYNKSEILNLAPLGYQNLKSIFPHLDYHPKSVKKSLFSYPLTYMGFSGYLNPLTNEAQVDAIIPTIKIPTTSSHEIAHQLGYAAENEANFIGCLAAINHDDIYFNYAGYTFGLRYCLNEIYSRDECLYEDLIADVNEGILKNYKETRDFWEAHQNPFEPLFKLFYSNYLKANQQTKGMESYSYVVALLSNYFDYNSSVN